MPTSGAVARFKRVQLALAREFSRKSLRVIERGTHRIIVGCPKGKYDAGAERCTVGTRPVAILHPLTETEPCPMCQRAGMGFSW